MNLIDENVEKESNEKQKKLTKIIVIAIVVLLAMVIGIIIFSNIKKKNTLQLIVDNEERGITAEMFLKEGKNELVKSEDGQIYVSVKGLANLMSIAYYNDEFNVGGEDLTKCYIKTGNEYTSYISGSDKIYKVIDNKSIKEENEKNNKNNNETEMEVLNDYEYQYFSIEDGVRYVNDEIYARADAIELGFNISIEYDEKNKNVIINSIDGMEKTAKKVVGEKIAVTGDDAKFSMKKLLKHGFVLIKSGTGEYGIVNYWNYKQGNYALSCKYSNIEYVESLGCLIVTSSENNKVGILKMNFDGDGSVSKIIEPKYDSITQLSEDGKYYLVKEDDRYGIIGVKENDDSVEYETILKNEYQFIGIENQEPYSNVMTSRYILAEKYIPIKKNDKWGLASLDGNILIVPAYDVIGCETSKVGRPVVVIENLKKDVDVVVFGKNVAIDDKVSEMKYRLVDTKTGGMVGLEAVDIYCVDNNGDVQYFLNSILENGDSMKVNIVEIYGNPNREKTAMEMKMTSSSEDNKNE